MITWRREYLRIGEGEKRGKIPKSVSGERLENFAGSSSFALFSFFFLRAFFFSAAALIKVSTPLFVWALEYLYPYVSYVS